MRFLAFAVFAFTGCAHLSSERVTWRSNSASDEEKAVKLLSSADEAYRTLADRRAKKVDDYNKAAVDLTILLREANGGQMWNRPLTLSNGKTTYKLRFAPGDRSGTWDPAYFTEFEPSSHVLKTAIVGRNRQDGVGGSLVGIRKTRPADPFTPRGGQSAPVTALLDFQGSDVTLSLVDPTELPQRQVAGIRHTMAADFSAPLGWYPEKSSWWNGLKAAVRVTKQRGSIRLSMLQPYDPDRIPLIFVHGLFSTSEMWKDLIRELEHDPELRSRYQCWVFNYPTGNPPAYSALRLREELAKVRQLHPEVRDYVLIGHSMGGLLARMQATTVTRENWDAIGKEDAARLFRHVQDNRLLQRTLTFDADPKVDRLVFIATPHRGSDVAAGGIGKIGLRLVTLPAGVARALTDGMGDALSLLTGDPDHLPNSISGLAPTSPVLKVLEPLPIKAPYHSIIGNRGLGSLVESSDGVVKYSSSHLDGAASERIVPSWHGNCDSKQTVKEIRRILLLHLRETGSGR